MKIILIILVFIFSYFDLSAQSLTVFNLDFTSYPAIKAKFYAFDSLGNQVTNLSPSNFTVLENDVQRNVTYVSCPPQKPPDALSSVLVIDVSGSMAGKGLDLARAAATAWVNCLPLGKSDCAITSFDDHNYFDQDFTTDKQKLLNAINNLQARGGTDYDKAFIEPQAGGIIAAKPGQHKRVIVFLSDGGPNSEPAVDSIIAIAVQNQITIYAVILAFPAPECIKKITTQTGGYWFENIVNEDQAKNAYLSILQIAQGSQPCDMEWQSEPECYININTVIKLDNPIDSTQVKYVAPHNASIDFQPISLRFKNVKPGVKVDSVITITANGVDFNISDITISNPLFDINPKSFLLKASQNQDLTISFIPPADSSYQFCRFDLVNDICPQNYFASSSYIYKTSSIPTLKVTFPDGGEEFLAGSDTIITWEGVTPQDTVTLEYSTDNGTNWVLITNKAIGLKYDWNNLPKKTSKICLIRAKQNNKVSDRTKDSLMLRMGTIDAVAISHNCKYAASSDSGNIYIWDTSTWNLIKIINDTTSGITALSYSPDDKLLAGACWDWKIRIWDAVTGKKIKTLGESPMIVTTLAFNYDGSLLASAGEGIGSALIKIWDVVTGKVMPNWDQQSIQNARVVQFSPDGNTLASGGDDKFIRLWNVKTANNFLSFGNVNPIRCISYSPDGQTIASGHTDSIVRTWNAGDGKLKNSLTGHTSGINALVFNSDGSQLLTASSDHTIRLWDLMTENTLKLFSGHTGGVNLSYFTPDGKEVTSIAGDNAIRFWDIDSACTISKFNIPGNPDYSLLSVAFSPDGSLLAAGCLDGKIRIWDTYTGTFLNLIDASTRWARSVTFEPNKNILGIGCENNTIQLWNIDNNHLISTLAGHKSFIYSIAFSPTESILASGSDDNTLDIWDINSEQTIRTITNQSSVWDVKFNPEGSIVAGYINSNIKLWDVNSGTVLHTIKTLGLREGAISYSPDGNILAYSDGSQYIKLYNTKLDVVIDTLSSLSGYIIPIAFGPEGNLLAAGDNYGKIQIWDLNQGTVIQTMTGHPKEVSSVNFSSQGDLLASCSVDATCIIWNLNPVRTLQQDQSDSTFAIVAPQGRSKDIDLGTELVGSTKDSVVSGFIENLGTFPLTIQDVRIKGSDSTDFLCIIGAKPFNVDVGQSRSVEFLFSPKTVGPRQALIEVQTLDSVYSVNIHGVGVQEKLASVIKIIDFGKVPVGAYKDTLLAATITNTSSTQMQITNTHHTTPNDKDFTTIAGGGAFTLNPGDTAKLSLRFKPSEAGRTSGGLAFDFNGTGSPIIIQLYGEGIIQNIPKCTLMSGSMEADAGDYIEVPIILQNSLLASQAGCYEVQTDLNFNSTLLYPLMEPRGTITNHVRTLHLIYPIKPGGSDTLGTISMEAAIGNAEATVLMLENPEIYGGFVSIDTLSGIFKLKNICKEGGTRLINPDGTAGIAQINPNPSSDEVELKINLKEKGRTSLEIINMLGTKVKMLFDEEKSIGENDIRFSTQDLGSGTYYLILKTPSEVITQQLIIMK